MTKPLLYSNGYYDEALETDDNEDAVPVEVNYFGLKFS